jgi:hypothetical protein
MSSGARSAALLAPEHRETRRSHEKVATKLAAIDTDDRLTPEREAEAARAAVDGVAAKVGSMGQEAVIAIAPTFPGLQLPRSGNPALDAIAAFQLCSLPMDASYHDDTPREHLYDERAWSLFISAAIFVTSSYLRLGYLEAGVSDEEAEAFLGSEAMTALKATIGGSQENLDSTESRCADPVLILMR